MKERARKRVEKIENPLFGHEHSFNTIQNSFHKTFQILSILRSLPLSLSFSFSLSSICMCVCVRSRSCMWKLNGALSRIHIRYIVFALHIPRKIVKSIFKNCVCSDAALMYGQICCFVTLSLRNAQFTMHTCQNDGVERSSVYVFVYDKVCLGVCVQCMRTMLRCVCACEDILFFCLPHVQIDCV